MRYVPYEKLGSTPNVIVDGAAQSATVLTLSHWPGSATPAHLKRDASAEIALAWLESGDPKVDADVVSNNHFDEDGLTGVWALLHPSEALARKELLADVARAGDFGVYRSRTAARIALAISTWDGYEEGLPKLLDLLDHPDRARSRWEEGDAAITASEARLDRGDVRIDERADLDLAIVTYAPSLPALDEACHPMALHTRTPRSRLLLVQGRRYEFRYRYESWVQYASRAIPPRLDLAPLAMALSKEDSVRWSAESIDEITPAMRATGESRLDAATVTREVERFLEKGST